MARGSPATLPGYHAGRAPANKGKKYPPTIMDVADVQGLLDNVAERTVERGRALIGLLYRTGMTVGEAVHLNCADVDWTPGDESVHLYSSRSLAERQLALDAAALALLRPWWELRQTLPGERLLCITEGETLGQQWGTSSVRTMLRDAREKAGVAAERVHPHAFRYSFLAELVIEQWPWIYMQVQLGLTTSRGLEKLLNNLGLATPSEKEVRDVVRTREWTPSLPEDVRRGQTALVIP